MTPVAPVTAPALVAHPPGNAKRGPSKADPFLRQALAARKRGDTKAFEAALLEAKKILAAEGRYSCCVKGGCTECTLEANCGCGGNLFEKKGVCKECLKGIKDGNGRYENVTPDILFEQVMELPGLLGSWPMNREGSGTSWLPESSPMYGRMGQLGSWRTMAMGLGSVGYTDAGGKRGESQLFGATQLMLMGQKRDDRERVLGLRAMFSLDPLTNGKKGYPNLFQTGETANGQPLQDRQHPHDALMELAASYSAPLGKSTRGFVYVAPAGEPALGPAAFQHRPSAWDNPLAPISHHWLDGTHITFGVATAGVTLGDRWKLEGSAFNGREPNEDRYGIDPIRLNSYSGRATYSPNRDTSLQLSYGYLRSPESLEPTVNQNRVTASVQHNRAFSSGDNLALLLAYGQNRKSDGHGATGAFLAEAAYLKGPRTIFARFDSAQKDELVGAPAGKFSVQKLSLGVVQNVREDALGQHGIGAVLDLYAYPSALKPLYGSAPVSATVFYRWRFGRM